jgi:hypothetical protein
MSQNIEVFPLIDDLSKQNEAVEMDTQTTQKHETKPRAQTSQFRPRAPQTLVNGELNETNAE